MTSRKTYNNKSSKKTKQHQIAESEEVNDTEKPSAPIIEIWENTYRMEPQKRFKTYLAEKEIKNVFEKNLNDDLKYDDIENIKSLSQKISSEIKEGIKNLDIPRYKIVVQTFIGQIKGQSLQIGSRFLWNANTDNYVSKQWKNVKKNLYFFYLLLLILTNQ